MPGTPPEEGAEAIPALWARETIEDLELDLACGGELKDIDRRIEEIALQHSVSSRAHIVGRHRGRTERRSTRTGSHRAHSAGAALRHVSRRTGFVIASGRDALHRERHSLYSRWRNRVC